jgi:hypothetical protein
MGIQAEHPDFMKYKAVWKKADDFYEGEEVVKEAGPVYLPALTLKQAPGEYESYKNRALFFDATFRTVQGLTGLGTWRLPNIKIPDTMKETIKTESVKYTIRELLKTGRSGLLVDRGKDLRGKETDPYIIPYHVSDITNWREDEYGLVLVVLRETEYVPKDDDPYSLELEVKYRELKLDEAGKYEVNIWSKVKKEDEDKWAVEETILPKKLGARMEYIPFVFINAEEADSTTIVKPPLLGVVNANLFHYRLSADYAHGLHWTALPTPWVSGASGMGDSPNLEIGSGSAWLLPETNCRAGYLEFTGQGLDPIANALQATEQQMAAIGARLLENQRQGVEAAETARIRQSGEMSILGSLVMSVGKGYEIAARYVAEWMNVNPDSVSVEMSTDFIKEKLDPQQLTALVGAYQSGGLSLEALVYNLETGEMLPPGTDAQEEMDRINSLGPATPEVPVAKKVVPENKNE